MTKNTRRIFVSILTLVLTVVAVGTTTFAWFTIGNIATVSGISGEVIGGEGLEIQMVIGAKETVFKNHLIDTDWTSVEPDDFKFTAIDSNLTMFETITSATNKGKLKEGAATVANGPGGSYLAITFNFRSLSGGTINLTDVDFPTVMTDAFKAGVAYTDVTGTPLADNADTAAFDASHALRLTFLENAGDLPSATGAVTYRKNHSVDQAHGQWSYMLAKQNEFFESDGTTPISTPRAVTGEEFDASNAWSIALNDDNLATGGYWEATVTVLVWVDGWDPHTFDAIYLQTLEFAITFTKES